MGFVGLFSFNQNTECMDFLEKDLEQIIMKTDVEKLAERGLVMPFKRKNQVRIGNYGVCDMIAVERDFWDESLSFTVFELKKEKIGISTFAQVCQYARGLKRYLDQKKPNLRYRVHIVMIGRTLDKSSSFCYLPSLFENIEIYTYNYEFDGIHFTKHQSYSLIDEGF